MYFNYKKDIEYTKIVLGLDSSKFSDYIGISRMTINRWIKGDIIPSYDSLEKLYSKIYDSNIHLIELKEEMYRSSLEKKHNLLFHGAKTEIIGHPSISYSEEKKDFGKGFYLGESFNQSASFVNGYDKSSIYIFDFDTKNVKIKEYSVSKEWMLLIAYFRGRLNEYSNSKYINNLLKDLEGIDVVVAPIADNTMYTTLDDFISGKITDLQCLNALSANRLGKQYVFLNDKVINENLKMIERCFYPKNQKIDFSNYRLEENELGKNKVKIALREYAGKGNYIEELLYE
ncbi:MAG: DUF3990 domain-containing protein [Acholeplasmatales bacterium]|nr:DUF3990 domain-containing protein [Acholeplasmatales bacterium]